MGRPLWLDQFVLLLQGAIAFLPPLLAAGWLARLITYHYSISHRSAAGVAILITLYILLLAVWIAGLMQANRLWAARQIGSGGVVIKTPTQPIWREPVVFFLILALALLPPTAAAFWLSRLIAHHYGMSIYSEASRWYLTMLTFLLLAGWWAGLVLTFKLWNARQSKQTNK